MHLNRRQSTNGGERAIGKSAVTLLNIMMAEGYSASKRQLGPQKIAPLIADANGRKEEIEQDDSGFAGTMVSTKKKVRLELQDRICGYEEVSGGGPSSESYSGATGM